MDWFLAIPLVVRLIGLFLCGAALGGQLNRGVYRLAWRARAIGPWSAPAPSAPPRRWIDRAPLVGWLFLRRETALHGRLFWLRPLLLETAMGLGLAGLYWHEVVRAALGPAGLVPDPAALHAQFLSHVVLISLMVVATFIDFDEQTIPDAITLPGTLTGLALAALLPASRPAVLVATGFAEPWERSVAALHLATPAPWPAWLHGAAGLACGLAAFLGWWLAVLPWTWTTRRGFLKAWRYAGASLARRISLPSVLLGVGGVAGVSLAWWWGGGHWESLCSALVGMAFGGALIWGVRIVGTLALRQEAMGFGDVTLMAMIGSFMGWQATLIVFFFAPFAAVVICVAQWLLTGRKDIAFGPYLCLAALFVLVRWPRIWTHSAEELFTLGWFIPAIVVVCLGLMGGLLVTWRAFREWLTFAERSAAVPAVADQAPAAEPAAAGEPREVPLASDPAPRDASETRGPGDAAALDAPPPSAPID